MEKKGYGYTPGWVLHTFVYNALVAIFVHIWLVDYLPLMKPEPTTIGRIPRCLFCYVLQLIYAFTLEYYR